MSITALYAALLTPLFVFLSLRVIGARRSARVSVGHGEDPALLRRMRVHANFAEYVPMALVLIALAESLRTEAWLLHATGLTLLLARVIHAYGVSQSPENITIRVVGMAGTFTAIITAALLCLAGAAGLTAPA